MSSHFCRGKLLEQKSLKGAPKAKVPQQSSFHFPQNKVYSPTASTFTDQRCIRLSSFTFASVDAYVAYNIRSTHLSYISKVLSISSPLLNLQQTISSRSLLLHASFKQSTRSKPTSQGNLFLSRMEAGKFQRCPVISRTHAPPGIIPTH